MNDSETFNCILNELFYFNRHVFCKLNDKNLQPRSCQTTPVLLESSRTVGEWSLTANKAKGHNKFLYASQIFASTFP